MLYIVYDQRTGYWLMARIFYDWGAEFEAIACMGSELPQEVLNGLQSQG